MIFELTEFLREKLDQFCNDLAMGSFLNLQNEVYFLIFSQVSPQIVASKSYYISTLTERHSKLKTVVKKSLDPDPNTSAFLRN